MVEVLKMNLLFWYLREVARMHGNDEVDIMKLEPGIMPSRLEVYSISEYMYGYRDRPGITRGRTSPG
jgi:hypothetical protein